MDDEEVWMMQLYLLFNVTSVVLNRCKKHQKQTRHRHKIVALSVWKAGIYQ